MTSEPLFLAAQRYFQLMEGADKTRVVEVFEADAVVLDDGQTYSGRAAIEGWLTGAASEFTTTSELLSSSPIRAILRVAGNFPGSPVDLRHAFTEGENGLVKSLRIEVDDSTR